MRLPVELQTQIFLRLPLTSLPTCKQVCKAFRTLIENPDFEHNLTSTSYSLLLQFNHKISGRIDRTSQALVSIDNTTKDVISYISLIPRIPHVGTLFLVGSCKGLVCFAVRTKNMYRDDILLLWNPFTEQSRYIRILEKHGYLHQQTMEFYFVSETNDYNILSIGYTRNSVHDIHVAVYRMSTNSWEIVDQIRLGHRFNCYEGHNDYGKRKRGTSVFLNGSFHWIFSSTDSSEIVSFNLETEELDWIRSIDHPWCIPEGIYDIGIIDESLALLYWSSIENNIELWVMSDNYEDEDSWVSKYKLGPNNVWLNGCWKNSVMTSDKHAVYFHNTNDLKMKKLMSPPEGSCLSGFSSFSLPHSSG